MEKKIMCGLDELPQLFQSGEVGQDVLLVNKGARPDWKENFLQKGIRGTLEEPHSETQLLQYLAAQEGCVLRNKGRLGERCQLTLVMPKSWQQSIAQSPMLESIAPEGELKKKLGKMNENDQLMQGRAFKWLLLPWAQADLLSIVIVFEKNPQDETEQDRLHALLKESILSFPIPQGLTQARENKSPIHLAEYDWIYSKEYVGLDRRRDPDGKFFDQFTFRGRRKILPASTAGRFLGFTDRLSPMMFFLFVAYLLLSCIDTVLSIKYIAFGPLTELNPLLRPLLEGQRVWIFTLVKNAASIGFFVVVSRFERQALGLFVAILNVLIYLILDFYWINIIY